MNGFVTLDEESEKTSAAIAVVILVVMAVEVAIVVVVAASFWEVEWIVGNKDFNPLDQMTEFKQIKHHLKEKRKIIEIL